MYGAGEQGWWETSWDRQDPISPPYSRGCLGATPMPPLSQAALLCHDAGRACPLLGPAGLDLLRWDRCVPGFPRDLIVHRGETLLGAISRASPLVHPELVGYPVPASVPNHQALGT